MKKKILLLITLVLIVQSLLCLGTAFAEEKVYTIDSAKFDVMLNKDGSADVTETWYVTYKKGDFTRFYKSIYFDQETPEEICSEHIDKGVKIDGVECKRVDDGYERKNYTYYIEDSSNEQMYNMYLASSGETRKYEVSYTRKDVVKRVNDDYYVFTHRFMSKGFEKNVNNIEINIRTYDDNAKMTVDKKTAGEATEGKKIQVKATDRSNLFMVRTKIEGSTVFDITKSSEINEDELRIFDTDAPYALVMTCWIIAALLVAIRMHCYGFNIVIIFLLFGCYGIGESDGEFYNFMLLVEMVYGVFLIKDWCLKLSLIFDKEKPKNIIEHWVPSVFSPAVFACMFSKNTYAKFFALLAEANAHGSISFNEELTMVTYRIDDYKPIADSLAVKKLEEIRKDLLGETFVEANPGETQQLSMKDIQHYFEQSATKTIKLVEDLDDIYVKYSGMVYGKYKLEKDNNLIVKMLDFMKIPFVSYSDIVKNPNDALNMLFFCSYVEHKKKKRGATPTYSAVDTMVMTATITAYALYESHLMAQRSSSSDGSGCSGCSSCGGGCGGCGGAD